MSGSALGCRSPSRGQIEPQQTGADALKVTSQMRSVATIVVLTLSIGVLLLTSSKSAQRVRHLSDHNANFGARSNQLSPSLTNRDLRTAVSPNSGYEIKVHGGCDPVAFDLRAWRVVLTISGQSDVHTITAQPGERVELDPQDRVTGCSCELAEIEDLTARKRRLLPALASISTTDRLIDVSVPIDLELALPPGLVQPGTADVELCAVRDEFEHPYLKSTHGPWAIAQENAVEFDCSSPNGQATSVTVARVDGSALGVIHDCAQHGRVEAHDIEWQDVGCLVCRFVADPIVLQGAVVLLSSKEFPPVERRVTQAGSCVFPWLPAGVWQLVVKGLSVQSQPSTIDMVGGRVIQMEVPIASAPDARLVSFNLRLLSNASIDEQISLALTERGTSRQAFVYDEASAQANTARREWNLFLPRGRSFHPTIRGYPRCSWISSPEAVEGDCGGVEIVGQIGSGSCNVEVTLSRSGASQSPWRWEVLTLGSPDSIAGHEKTSCATMRDLGLSDGLAIAIFSDKRQFDPIILRGEDLRREPVVTRTVQHNVVVGEPPLRVLFRFVDEEEEGLGAIGIAIGASQFETDRFGLLLINAPARTDILSASGYKILNGEDLVERIPLDEVSPGAYEEIELHRQ